MNAIDRLRKMLDEANIPYESYCETYEDRLKDYVFDDLKPTIECEADNYCRNQIIVGRNKSTKTRTSWLFDAIYQYGSCGRHEDMLETYGEFGSDDNGEPNVMTPQEAFNIIKKCMMRNNFKEKKK